AAVGSGDDVFTPHHGSIALQALRDKLGMLDKIGGGVEYTWNDSLSFRQLDLLKYLPFMFMTRVGSFKGNSNRARFQHFINDVPQWNIAVMRSFVVSPA